MVIAMVVIVFWLRGYEHVAAAAVHAYGHAKGCEYGEGYGCGQD